MRNAALILLCLLALISDTPRSTAQQRQSIDVGRAQIEMLNRIEQFAQTYAKQIGVQGNFIDYCRQEMHLKTYAHPRNDYIPFGVNYSEITDQQRLNSVISARENYEISFIMLCLANVK